MLNFLLILFITICASFLPERFLKPTPPKLSFDTIVLQSLLVALVFLVLTLIVQRTVFSGLAIIVFLIILIAVSNAKFRALKEPMVFSDFAMFAQAFKHPRLYFPFLGLIPVILAPLIIVALIYTVLTLEPALPFSIERILSTITAIVFLYYVSKKNALRFNLTRVLETDNHHFGLQNTLFSYFMHSRSKAHQDELHHTIKSSPFNLEANDSPNTSKADTISTPPPFLPILCKPIKPNITVIQSESFFDARRLHPSIKGDILKNFDAINADSIQYGKLEVPAWGANTMRSEFSFLTGLKFDQMGFYRYYPYQFLSDFPAFSIANTLQAQGYHCVCIHPHHSSFFGRNKVFPRMGFNEFIDIDEFKDKQTFGPYISDESVSNKIIETTKKYSDVPLFIFVITMENHGPLHLEKTAIDEHQNYYTSLQSENLPTELNDLTVYLRHLKNADKMIKTLTNHFIQEYRNNNVQTRVCFYGDHVPSMPMIYSETQYEDEHSDYFIWDSSHKVETKVRENTQHYKELSIDTLALSLLKS